MAASAGFFGKVSANLGCRHRAPLQEQRPAHRLRAGHRGRRRVPRRRALRQRHALHARRRHATQTIYWHGPSIGTDVGAAGSKTLFLIYKLQSARRSSTPASPASTARPISSAASAPRSSATAAVDPGADPLGRSACGSGPTSATSASRRRRRGTPSEWRGGRASRLLRRRQRKVARIEDVSVLGRPCSTRWSKSRLVGLPHPHSPVGKLGPVGVIDGDDIEQRGGVHYRLHDSPWCPPRSRSLGVPVQAGNSRCNRGLRAEYPARAIGRRLPDHPHVDDRRRPCLGARRLARLIIDGERRGSRRPWKWEWEPSPIVRAEEYRTGSSPGTRQVTDAICQSPSHLR